jgi:small subunit ribosomal protein S7
MRCNNFSYREVEKDEKYHSELVTKLINKVMRHGKKEMAKRYVYDAMELIKQTINKEPLEVLEIGIANLSPTVENKSRKRGGATIQVPFEVKEPRRISISLR